MPDRSEIKNDWMYFLAITFFSLSVSLSTCLTFHSSVCLSIYLSLGSTFPNGYSPWVRGFCITFPAQCPSLLLITHKRLGVTFSGLVLIVLHEQGFGVMIPYCEINLDKNIIEPTISHMISKYEKLLFTFYSKTTSNHLLPIWHL